MPKIYGAKNLSADEIAVLLGFTDAADFTAALAAKIAAATLTTNGDLLTRTAGVPARLGLGSSLQVLRTNAGATALEFADPSGGGFTPKYARIERITSDQTGISGSYAVDYLQYNSEAVDVDGILTISGDDVTLAAAGTYLILQHEYGISGGFFGLNVNGTEEDRLLTSATSYDAFSRFVTTTGANQIIKFTCLTPTTQSMAYTDGTRPGKVNFVEILRIA